MVTIRNETHGDIAAREDVLDRVWGAARFEKTAERLREGRSPLRDFRLSPSRTNSSSARCGFGTSAPVRDGRLCCSVHSPSTRRSVAAASALH